MAVSGRFPLLLLLGLVAVVVQPTREMVLLWVGLCVLVAVVDLLLAVSPTRLDIRREPVEQVRLGGATTTSLLVTNTSRRRVRGMLRDAWPPSAGATGDRHRLALPGGERRRVTTALHPTRRGDRPADRVTVRSFGPLRVAARQRSFAVGGGVRALPPFTSRKHLPSRLATLRQLDGRSAVRVRGQGTEFDSLRDYVEGDDVRSIDWRATARREHVVVRTWQPERDRRVILVLDTSRTSAGRVGDMPRLDSEMDAALLLAALASRAGDRVDFVAGDRWVRARVTGASRTTLLGDLVRAMAPLEPALLEASWPTLATAIPDTTRRRALVVLLTALEPAAIEESLLAHPRVADDAPPGRARLGRRPGPRADGRPARHHRPRLRRGRRRAHDRAARAHRGPARAPRGHRHRRQPGGPTATPRRPLPAAEEPRTALTF